MESLKESLKKSIEKGLPGTDVQWKMASSDRMLKDFPRVPGSDARVAAVLILLFPDDNKICTVFMQRPDYTGIHGGQISFPGGKKEPGDESILDTALREAFEETGIAPASVSVLGTLTPLFIPVSNMIVTPVVGWTESRPSFSHDPAEVVFLIEAPLSNFLDPSIIKTTPMMLRGEMIDVRYFAFKDHVIWGATAMMLNELLEIIRRDNINLEPR
jgi:8-oxo-dGTP pyrophosphatase MutT (NUDIX family)